MENEKQGEKIEFLLVLRKGCAVISKLERILKSIRIN